MACFGLNSSEIAFVSCNKMQFLLSGGTTVTNGAALLVGAPASSTFHFSSLVYIDKAAPLWW